MKPYIVKLSIAIISMVLATGCVDFEFPSGSGGGSGGGTWSGTSGGSAGDDWNFDFENLPASFYSDSIEREGETSVRIWAHIQYDSILIIQQFTVSYWIGNYDQFDINKIPTTSMTTTLLTEPDTVDFRTLRDSMVAIFPPGEWNYSYQIPVSGLGRGLDYIICVKTDYVEKGESLSETMCWFIKLE